MSPSDEQHQGFSSSSNLHQRGPRERESAATISTINSSRGRNSAALSLFSNPRASIASTNTSYSVGIEGFHDPSRLSTSDRGSGYGWTLPSSHPRNSQPIIVPARYACTFCDQKAFLDKYTWKKHEEKFHEKLLAWDCLFGDRGREFNTEKDTRDHHKEAHQCLGCAQPRRSDCVGMRVRRLHEKHAWGCGFCEWQPFRSWDDRCSHIADVHYEKKSDKSDWRYTTVIWNLLQQPHVSKAWDLIITEQFGASKEVWPNFDWQGIFSADSLKARELRIALETNGHDQKHAHSLAYEAYQYTTQFLGSRATQMTSQEPIRRPTHVHPFNLLRQGENPRLPSSDQPQPTPSPTVTSDGPESRALSDFEEDDSREEWESKFFGY